MRRAWLFASVPCFALAACANILGIDDGAPRNYDASAETSVIDVSVGDVATDHDEGGDAAADAPFSALSCGTDTCNFAIGQACCRTGSSTYACVNGADACAGGTFIPCDRPEQCPTTDAGKEICCTDDVLVDGGTYVAQTVGCHLAAQCSPIPTHYILCGDNNASDCPPEAGCSQSVSTLPPFLLCK